MSFPKEYVREQVFKVMDELEDAYTTLDQLLSSFDFDDQRQEDFAHDAFINEHLSGLLFIIKSLGQSVRKDGLLDQHYDRESA